MQHIMFKKVGAFASALALVAAAFSFMANGQTATAQVTSCPNPPSVATLNPYPVGYTDPAPTCYDYPLISARLENGAYPQTQSAHNAGLTVKAGDVVYALVYVHNGAAVNLDPNQTIARNVTVNTSVDLNAGNTHRINVTAKGDNTNSISGSFTINTPDGSRLELIPNSGEMFDRQANVVRSGLNIGNTSYTIGNMLPCFDYSIYLRFKLKVVGNPPSVMIEKKVQNMTTGQGFADAVSAKPGDAVRYQVVVRNTGSVEAKNVRVTDSFNVSNMVTQIRDVTATASYSGTWPDITFASIPAGGSVTIAYAGTAQNTTGRVCNTATATVAGGNTAQASACVDITTPPPGPNIVLSKRAWNDTKNVDAQSKPASREDFITYTLVTQNTGGSVASNYVVRDDLSGILPLADMVDLGGGRLEGQTIVYPGLDVAAGQTVTKTFRVRVKYALASNLSYVMRNTYGNTVTVIINTPPVPFEAPKTGAATGALGALGFGLLSTAGFALAHRKKLLTKLFN